MKIIDRCCNEIQQVIAIGQKLTEEQCIHVNDCVECGMLQLNIEQLDNLMTQDLPDLVPEGFANRILEQLPKNQSHTTSTDSIFSHRLFVLFTQSRFLQTILLGLGIAVGISHVIRFFLSMFIATMAAAL